MHAIASSVSLAHLIYLILHVVALLIVTAVTKSLILPDDLHRSLQRELTTRECRRVPGLL